MKPFPLVILVALFVLLIPAEATSNNPQKPNAVCSQIKTKVLKLLPTSAAIKNAPVGKLTLDAGSTALKIDAAACPVDDTVARRMAQTDVPPDLVERIDCGGRGESIMCCASAGKIMVCCTISTCMTNAFD